MARVILKTFPKNCSISKSRFVMAPQPESQSTAAYPSSMESPSTASIAPFPWPFPAFRSLSAFGLWFHRISGVLIFDRDLSWYFMLWISVQIQVHFWYDFWFENVSFLMFSELAQNTLFRLELLMIFCDRHLMFSGSFFVIGMDLTFCSVLTVYSVCYGLLFIF